MSDDPQDLEFQVEADATQAVRASNTAAQALVEVASQVQKLEGALKGIFTGVMPEGMAQLREYADLMKKVSQMPDARTFGRVTRTIQSGGPQSALNRATFQGVLSDLKNDPALQRLQFEKQTNQVLEARQRIYRSIRASLPDDASSLQRVNTYRKALSELGAMPAKADEAYGQWKGRTLAEAKAFETQLREVKLTEAQKTADAEQAIYERAMRRSAANLSRISDPAARQTQANAVIGRLSAYGDRRGVPIDPTRLQATYEDEVQRRLATQVQMPPLSQDEMAARSQQRVRQAVSDRSARFGVAGGSAMFGIEAHTMANYALMGAGIGAAVGVGKQVIDLDNALKGLQATAGLTHGEMGVLSKTILDVGASSNQSLKDIADGTTELVRAGYSVSEVAAMIRPLNALAIATRSTFKEASDAATIALRTFGLAADRTKGVTDALAELATRTKIPLGELSKAFESVGEVARGSNVQFEEVSAGFKMMADAGLKTSAQLGTGMKMLIEQLDTPSAKLQAQLAKVSLTAADVDVKANGLGGSLSNLAKAGFTNAEALAGMNVRAAQAYIALSQNVDGFNKLTTAITQGNTATNVAQTAMGSLENQAKRLANVAADVAYKGFDPMLHTLTAMAGALSAVLAGVAHLTPVLAIMGTVLSSFTIVKIAEWLGGMAIGAVTAGTDLEVLTLKEQASAVAAQLATMSFEEMAAAAGVASVAFLANPITLATVALTVLIGAVGAFAWGQEQANQKTQEFANKAQEAGEKTKEYADRIKEIDGFVEMLTERHARLATNTQEAGAAAQIATQKFGQWGLQIDRNIGQVDTLIGRLVELRRQQAASALEAAKQQKTSLQGENKALTGQYKGAVGSVSGFARDVLQLHPREAQQAGLTGVLQQISSGTLSPDQVQSALALIRTKRGMFRANGGGEYLDTITKGLDRSADPAAKIAGNNQAMTDADVTISDWTMQASGTGAAFNARVSALKSSWLKREEAAKAIKDPRTRAAAEISLHSQEQGEFSQFNAGLQSQVTSMLADPQVSNGINAASKLSGRTPPSEALYQLTHGNDQYQTMSAVVGDGSNISDPRLLKARAARLKVLAENAKRQGNSKLYKQYMDQASTANEQASDLTNAARPDYDPFTSALEENENAGADDARTTGGVDSINKANARRGAAAAKVAQRKAAKEDGADADTLKKQIEDYAPTLGPTPADITAGHDKLSDMLKQWHTAKLGELNLQKAGPEELKKFQVESTEFVNKILKGNVAAATKLLQELADQSAEDTKSRLATDLEFHGGDLSKNVADVTQKYMEAQNAALAASDAKFAAEHPDLDPKTAGTAVAARNKILQDGAKKMIDAELSMVEAWSKGEALRINEQQNSANRPLEAQSAQIRAQSNYWGQQHLGDTHRYMGSLAQHGIDVQTSQNAVTAARANVSLSQSVVTQDQALFDKTPDGKAKDDAGKALEEAKKNAVGMQAALDKAQDDLTALNAQVQPFTSASEAIAAAWRSWLDKSGANKGAFEQLADGLTHTLETASTSLAKFFGDIEAGGQRGKHAFADLARSMLQDMLNSLNQLMANKLLMMLFGDDAALPGQQGKSGGAGGGIAGGLLGLLTHGSTPAAGGVGSALDAPISGAGAPGGGLIGGLLGLLTHGSTPAAGGVGSDLDAPLSGDAMMPGVGGSGGVGSVVGLLGKILGSVFHFAQGTDGIPGRDSVPSLTMPGEGVLNKSAMDMLGSQTVRQMNGWGNRRESRSISDALADRKPQPAANVWVVAPTARPQLGKNDVLQVVSDDMLTGGQTKKLIKAIMADQL